jgi:hypothetical protein
MCKVAGNMGGESVAERGEEWVHFHGGIALPPRWWLQGATL